MTPLALTDRQQITLARMEQRGYEPEITRMHIGGEATIIMPSKLHTGRTLILVLQRTGTYAMPDRVSPRDYWLGTAT